MLKEEEEEIEKGMSQISQLVNGKRVSKITYRNPIIGDEDNLCDIEIDGGECYIVLDDDSVIRVWNSEWGGIELLRKAKK